MGHQTHLRRMTILRSSTRCGAPPRNALSCRLRLPVEAEPANERNWELLNDARVTIVIGYFVISDTNLLS